MTDEEKKIKRMEYLAECIKKFLFTEPKLTLKELAFLISEEIGDFEEFFTLYKKENKKP